RDRCGRGEGTGRARGDQPGVGADHPVDVTDLGVEGIRGARHEEGQPEDERGCGDGNDEAPPPPLEIAYRDPPHARCLAFAAPPGSTPAAAEVAAIAVGQLAGLLAEAA